MKTHAMQELVKKIFGDEKTRHEFQSDPESVLSRFSLTEQEKKAVRNANARFGLVTGGSAQLAAALKSSSEWYAPGL